MVRLFKPLLLVYSDRFTKTTLRKWGEVLTYIRIRPNKSCDKNNVEDRGHSTQRQVNIQRLIINVFYRFYKSLTTLDGCKCLPTSYPSERSPFISLRCVAKHNSDNSECCRWTA
jgi:hypothetical protein